jgi:hypothetical protein
VNQTNEFSTVSYSMSRVVGSLIISDQEEDENQGRAAIFKILTGKIKSLDESISRQFATYHTSIGTGTDPNGLANLIPADPTTGIVGGINLANESQWRPSSYNFAGTLSPENIEEAFDDITELDLNRTNDGQRSPNPTVIFAGRNIYRMHKAAARDKQMIQLSETGTGKKLVNLGIVGTMHNKIPVLFDEKLSANQAYFINEEYLTLHVLKWRQHEDQEARCAVERRCNRPPRRVGRAALLLAHVPHPRLPHQLRASALPSVCDSHR